MRYANANMKLVKKNQNLHNPYSSLLYHFDETPIGERISCVIFLAICICNSVLGIIEFYNHDLLNTMIMQVLTVRF